MSYQESPEETSAREREYLVNWMRCVLFEKKDIREQQAFMAKVAMSAAHHNITLDELRKLNEKKPPDFDITGAITKK
jgi:hypothetical protein